VIQGGLNDLDGTAILARVFPKMRQFNNNRPAHNGETPVRVLSKSGSEYIESGEALKSRGGIIVRHIDSTAEDTAGKQREIHKQANKYNTQTTGEKPFVAVIVINK
jgi:hypothetical protein